MPRDSLEAVKKRIHLAQAHRQSCILFLSAAGLCVQRGIDRVAAGQESLEAALAKAHAAEAAALSVPYVAALGDRNDSL